MANTIITKNSSTASAVPTAGDLVQGELAVNVTDKRLFTEDAGGNIVEIGTNPSTINIDAGTIDGTAIGGTTPTTGAFTTLSASTSVTSPSGLFTNLSASGSVTLSGGTANGVAYLNGSKVLTSGSALTFDGTNLGVGTSSPESVLHAVGSASAYTPIARIATSTGPYVGIGSEGTNYSWVQAFNSKPLYINPLGNDTVIGIAGGNLGLGVTPSAWNSVYRALQLPFGASLTGRTDTPETLLASNTYRDSGGFKYFGTGLATAYFQASGAHSWHIAPSGTAGNAISFTQAMTLHASGGLSLGNTSDPGAGTLNVNGITVGRGAGAVSTNTAVGASALASGSLSGGTNTGVGYFALNANTTGANNTAVANGAMEANTTGTENSAFGSRALRFNTTGSYNSAFGRDALFSNTTASNNTAVGYQAGYSNTTGTQNTSFGAFAGYSRTTGGYNLMVGMNAGYYGTTGTGNTFVGQRGDGAGAGQEVTTGSKNTILGGYNGNQGGLDIRTLSNYLVLSDGDGNPRIYHNGTTVVIPNLPTSSAGLPSGGLYVAAGVLMVA